MSEITGPWTRWSDMEQCFGYAVRYRPAWRDLYDQKWISVQTQIVETNGWIEDGEIWKPIFGQGEGYEPTDDDVLMDGTIKWDGCSNWDQPNPVCIHFCSIMTVQQFTHALHMCYTLAHSLMPDEDKDEFILSSDPIQKLPSVAAQENTHE